MEKIALIIGETFVYWSSVLLTLSVITAVCTYLAVYLPKSRNGNAAALSIPVAFALSVLLSRFLHWYCRTDSYASLEAAMTNLSGGGFALMGVFAGCFITALLLRLLGISRNLPQMLDCMSIAGAAGIAVGRLASFFNGSGRGFLVESTWGLPWAYPLMNSVSGVEEYRLATFFLQAIVTAVIFAGLLVFWLLGQRKDTWKDGDVCILFLLLHGAAQVLLDSTRYDSLFFRSNGFVSIVQVLGALAIGLAAFVFSVRLVRSRGWRKWYLVLWLMLAALLGLGGYMEYHVQRHGSEALFAYSVMGGCLAGLVLVCLLIRFLASGSPKENELHEKQEEIPAEKMVVNGKSFAVVQLLGKGKGGYSYLVTDGQAQYVLKQIHHEPCDYYAFGDKMESELRDYQRLREIGIPMPELLDADRKQERILKEFIPGDTIYTLVKEDRMKADYLHQMEAMCRKLYSANTNIDYFPTNFVVCGGLLFYVDYECNDYMQQWDFEHWGIHYWSKTPKFLEHDTKNR